jgi:hypothetical protein
MNINLFWSFDTRLAPAPVSEYYYDLYRASMIRAKFLGYEINFYGNDIAIEKLSSLIDNVYDITTKNFEIIDDLKLYIHTQHDLNCVTIDGDLMLYEKLKFIDSETTKVYFDFPETDKDVIREENNIYNGYWDLKKVFEKYNTKYFFPNFNYDGNLACNTGLIKFNDQKIKDLFLHEFIGLKNYYIKHIYPYEKQNPDMVEKIRFIMAQYQFGCIIRNLEIPVGFLEDHNDYLHMFGGRKYEENNVELVYSILKNNR